MKLARISLLIATLMSAGAAQAADLPDRKAPPAPFVAPPVFTWAGAYVGAYAGYAWGRTRVVDTGVLAEAGAATNGGVGGVLAGYNWQMDKIVLGLEGSIGPANLRGHGNVLVVAAPIRHYDVTWTGELRARAGIAIEPRTLVFAAAGLAVADFNFHDASNPATFALGAKFVGWTVGVGIDHAFTDNLVGRIEYLYADYGKKTYTITVVPPDWYSAGFTSQIIRAAAIWKF